jgi:hypothetical protein
MPNPDLFVARGQQRQQSRPEARWPHLAHTQQIVTIASRRHIDSEVVDQHILAGHGFGPAIEKRLERGRAAGLILLRGFISLELHGSREKASTGGVRVVEERGGDHRSADEQNQRACEPEQNLDEDRAHYRAISLLLG